MGLDQGHPPSALYLSKVEQQTLPPGTGEVISRPPASYAAAAQGTGPVQPSAPAQQNLGTVVHESPQRTSPARACLMCCGCFCIVIIILSIIGAATESGSSSSSSHWGPSYHPPPSPWYTPSPHPPSPSWPSCAPWRQPIPTLDPHCIDMSWDPCCVAPTPGPSPPTPTPCPTWREPIPASDPHCITYPWDGCCEPEPTSAPTVSHTPTSVEGGDFSSDSKALPRKK